MNIDSARTVQIHATTIKNNLFLRKVYELFYQKIEMRLYHPIKGCRPATRRDDNSKIVIELGSGGGFLKKIIPYVITSDVVKAKGIDRVFAAEKIPFKKNSVDAFVMLNVLHHIKNPQKALSEMQRCLKTGGKIVMIEPWNTPFSGFIYQTFHHEPFNPQGTWSISKTGRLSGANGALPWILFQRDRKMIEKKFPRLTIKSIELHTPLLYLLSGGLSRSALFPAWTVPFFVLLEWIGTPLLPLCALFATLELRKIK